MELRFPGKSNQRQASEVGIGEVYSHATVDGVHLALVRFSDHSIVTARIPQQMRVPQIGEQVEVVQNPVRASERVLASVGM